MLAQTLETDGQGKRRLQHRGMSTSMTCQSQAIICILIGIVLDSN